MEISGKRIDIWVRLGKAKKERHGIKRKKVPTLLDISNLKIKKTFGRFNEHPPHFQLKADFLSYCSFQYPEFENIYTLAT